MSAGTKNTCNDLRQLWNSTKERLQAVDPRHPTVVRVHRALSWLARVENDSSDLDIALLCHWVALNSLYGSWDTVQKRAIGHQESFRRFLERILRLDRNGRLVEVLTEHKRLVLTLLDDKYLNDYFWEEPQQADGRLKRQRHQAQVWYVEKRWLMILENVLERIYLLRCQLVHGAATCGGNLNRTAVNRSVMMLGHLLPVILEVVIVHGADEDWGAMCYPPIPRETSRSPAPHLPR